MAKGYKPVRKKGAPPPEQVKVPTRKELLTAQCSAMTLQLGTIDFNMETEKARIRAKIAELMREIQAITAAEKP